MKLRISGDKLTIASAHMLTRHDKCARLHGHNYLLEIEAEGELNEKNMVVDFGEFKKTVTDVLEEFDHKVLIPKFNKNFTIESTDKEIKVKTCEGKFYRFPVDDVVIIPLESTTVELLSKHIHDLIKEIYPHLKITIIMSETPTSIAIYEGE